MKRRTFFAATIGTLCAPLLRRFGRRRWQPARYTQYFIDPATPKADISSFVFASRDFAGNWYISRPDDDIRFRTTKDS